MGKLLLVKTIALAGFVLWKSSTDPYPVFVGVMVAGVAGWTAVGMTVVRLIKFWHSRQQ